MLIITLHMASRVYGNIMIIRNDKGQDKKRFSFAKPASGSTLVSVDHRLNGWTIAKID